ncbi:ABC transporter ATP-binding protein [Candidatus Sumerlaeota bacterium]|nr:ABC transporter ATP-binding protein [Candidatus Sumerlaeota bacterium]
MLTAKNLSFSYERRAVLTDISLSLEQGELVGLIGPNGAGKSTLIKVLSGVLSPEQGEVVLAGIPLSTLSAREIARRIAVVPQSSGLVFPYKVLEVVLMGRYAVAEGRLFDHPTDVKIAYDMLGEVDALGFADRSFHELSGGEQQLVIIARALAQQTPILLLDEPASALDLKHQVFIARLLSRLVKRERKAVLIAGHNINYLARFCHRLVVIKHGRIIAQGEPRQIITPELISEVYETTVEILCDKCGNPIVTLPGVE